MTGALPEAGLLPSDRVPGAAPGSALSDRLTALARLVQIGTARDGPDGFSEKLLNDAEQLLAQAGQRLRMSSAHTVVALAGGTGSGKSSLFNRLAGADFSAVGVTRPVTTDPHACVWGVAGSGPLLEWLGIQRRHRYARSSPLDRGEDAMAGLILLDLPDSDSVVTGASDQVDRLVGLADLMVWVLDPQKYADAAVHRRYLVPLSGHSEVIAVVLNQADRLSAGQAEDCVADLRRLLDSEDLHDVQVLLTSALAAAASTSSASCSSRRSPPGVPPPPAYRQMSTRSSPDSGFTPPSPLNRQVKTIPWRRRPAPCPRAPSTFLLTLSHGRRASRRSASHCGARASSARLTTSAGRLAGWPSASPGTTQRARCGWASSGRNCAA